MALRAGQVVARIFAAAILAIAAAVILTGDPEKDMADAVRENNLADVQKLLRRNPALANAKVWPQGSRTGRLASTWGGRFVMHVAVASFDDTTPILDALAQSGADLGVRLDGRTLLHFAADAGNLAAAKWLLDREADVNARIDCNDCPELGRTPLHEAQRSKDREMNELLLARGADVSAADATGQTALHISAEIGSATGAWVLCTHGGDPQARDHRGRTPSDVARDVDRAGRKTVHTEVYGPGELAEWLRPEGACAKLALQAQRSGRPAPEADALAVFREYACSRGATEACSGAK